MANFLELNFACNLVKSQECDTVQLFDATRQHKIGLIEGTPGECAAGIMEFYENTSGAFYVEAFRARVDARRGAGEHTRGAKAFKDRPLVFMLGERRGGMRDGHDYMQRRRDRDDDEEEEEEEEAAPAVQPFLSDEVAKEALQLLKGWLGSKMAAPSRGISGPEQPVAPPAGNPERSHSQTKLSADEVLYMRRVGQAIARMRKEDPEGFANYSSVLLNMYPDANQQQPENKPA